MEAVLRRSIGLVPLPPHPPARASNGTVARLNFTQTHWQSWQFSVCAPVVALASFSSRSSRVARGRCRVHAAASNKTVANKLSLPPGKPGNAFLDLLKYVKDPDGFIATQVKNYGPVFQMNYFGRKTVIVGGADGVLGFTSAEKEITKSALPDTFSQLHTAYGTMNQAGKIHKSSRVNLISAALCEEAFDAFLPVIRRRCVDFLDSLESRGTFFPAQEFKDWSVALFAELFTGIPFDDEMKRLLYTYNEGLYGLVPLKLPFTAFGRGFKAKDELVKRLRKQIEDLKRTGQIEEPQYAALRRLMKSKDENGEPWSMDHVATSAMIMVWGAYVELASLLADAIYLTASYPEVREKAFAEASGAPAATQSELKKLRYLQGILDETLRVKPPSGGGFRLAEEDLEIAGYRIPKGFVVSADPRITNMDPELHPDPLSFNPDRFVECPATSLPKGTWFPGGIGLHGCPGIPLAMLISKVFLADFVQRFKNWQPTSASKGKEGWVTIPIRILGDKYEMEVTKR
ncbi:cyp120 [Symbiodinium pilosum]|uniref:Cyp120 protein n=1 Tax=Symbiodinium pilosum TaxID=2952 RepID=A0A812VEY7_SYMPI|nr:cyp120 [Symbiodinium pilosum]